MSALLSLAGLAELDLYAEAGCASRVFLRNIRVPNAVSYDECMFLAHVGDRLLPNRQSKYRNHFALYRACDDTVVVVLCETRHILQSQDAQLIYHCIRIAEPHKSARAVFGNWTVSYDGGIEFSRDGALPLTARLLCSGEWWYFEKGYVLNGVSAFDAADCAQCHSIFIYYELLQRHELCAPPPQIPAPLPAVPQTSLLLPPGLQTFPPEHATQQLSSPLLVAQQPSLPLHATQQLSPPLHTSQQTSLPAHTISQPPLPRPVTLLPSLDSAAQPSEEQGPLTFTSLPASSTHILAALQQEPVVTRNDAELVPPPTFTTVVPSQFWLEERGAELQRGDISYFLVD